MESYCIWGKGAAPCYNRRCAFHICFTCLDSQTTSNVIRKDLEP